MARAITVSVALSHCQLRIMESGRLWTYFPCRLGEMEDISSESNSPSFSESPQMHQASTRGMKDSNNLISNDWVSKSLKSPVNIEPP